MQHLPTGSFGSGGARYPLRATRPGVGAAPDEIDTALKVSPPTPEKGLPSPV